MAQDYTQAQLEEMVEGKPTPPRATFFEKAVLNKEKSVVGVRRVYDKVIYIKQIASGVDDFAAYKAQDADIRKYPEEYQYFLSNRQGVREIGVDIIPNLDIAHLQELRDFGMNTITKLAAAHTVPPHLEYARQAAIVLHHTLKEMKDGKEQRQTNEGQESPVKTEALPQADRQRNTSDVERQPVPESQGNNGRKTEERVHSGRRLDDSQVVLASDWTISGFTR